MLLIPTIALAQGATTAKRPTVSAKPVRSDEAEGARWLQARWNGQRDEALGGRMHGGAGAKNWYASRRVESDVGPRRDGRGHSEGSAVTLQFVLVWTASHPHGSMALSASQLDERKSDESSYSHRYGYF